MTLWLVCATIYIWQMVGYLIEENLQSLVPNCIGSVRTVMPTTHGQKPDARPTVICSVRMLFIIEPIKD